MRLVGGVVKGVEILIIIIIGTGACGMCVNPSLVGYSSGVYVCVRSHIDQFITRAH